MRSYVVATAGHVDHGKSTLVRALTGMEPDRFAEERRRGMTIDLGFAWTTLPSGARLAFVDVPGHQRFIANMLAGLGPSPVVMFVVAADGGWSAQSTDHLAAADALDVRSGLLVVTRSDLADPEPARQDALARIASSSLGNVESVVVSSKTGEGIADLRAALDRAVAPVPEPDESAPIRLWLDRSFSIRGSGTVVTGTLAAGTVRVGSTLQLSGRAHAPVNVRALQSAGAEYELLTGVSRVALNLRGIASGELGRGDALLTPDAWYELATLDARLTQSDSAAGVPQRCVLHVGTAAVPVRIRHLDDEHARLQLDRPLPLRVGDRAVLRDPSRHAVVAAVQILDADPPPLRRRGAGRARALALASFTGRADAVAEVARRGFVRRDHLDRLGIDTRQLRDVAGWLIDPALETQWINAAAAAVRDWAGAHPLDPPMPAAALTRVLGLPDSGDLWTEVVTAAGLRTTNGKVTADNVSSGLGRAQASVDAVIARLRADPFRAPEAAELSELNLGRRELAAAEQRGLLLRISDVVLLPDAPQTAVAVLRRFTTPFTLSEARQALGTTRRVAVPLLEHLDERGYTRFVDATRRIVVN